MVKSEINKNNNSLVKLAGPIFIELVLTMLVGYVSQYMISSYSQNSVAAIGNANQILNLLLILFSVISMSTTILVSQYIGSKNNEKISIIYTLSIFVNLVFSAFIILIILLFSGQIFKFMDVPPEVIKDATIYIKMIGGFIFFQALNATFSAIFRSNRMMKYTMIISIAINIFNVLGNLVLINGAGPIPAMGVMGSAIATNISRFAGVCLYIYFFIKKFDTKISFKALRPFPKVELTKLLGIGLPSGGESLSYSMAMTFILKYVNSFGTHVINTKIYAGTFAWFSWLYSSAVSQACQVIIGNFMGAGEVEEADKRTKKTLIYSVLISIVMSTTMFLCSDLLFGIFTDNPKILALGKKIMFIEIFLEMGKSTNITLVRCLQATGDILFPMIIGIVSMWVVAFGLAYFLGVVCGLGLVGVWIGMALDEDIRGIIFIFRWRQGKWKNIRLAKD